MLNGVLASPCLRLARDLERDRAETLGLREAAGTPDALIKHRRDS
jgi:hypothetical protein